MKLIVTADLHLRGNPPPCRVNDDWICTQKEVLYHMLDLCVEHKTVLVIAGDLFHTPKVSKEVEIMLINFFKLAHEKERDIFIIPGNHDMNYQKHQDNTSYGLLASFPWEHVHFMNIKSSDNAKYPSYNFGEFQVLHTLIDPEGTLPGSLAPGELLKGDAYGLTITGDNHQSFICRKQHKLLINPGTPIRQKRNEANYEPGVFLVDTGTLKYKKLIIPEFGTFELTEGKKEGVILEDNLWSILKSLPEKIDNMNFMELINKEKVNFPQRIHALINNIQEEHNEN